MAKNQPIGRFEVASLDGDVANWGRDYLPDECSFCGRKFNALGGASLFIFVLLDAKYIDAERRGCRVGTGGPLCFKCFNGGPQRMADTAQKRADRLKKPGNKESEIFTATIFRSFTDFSAFEGYALAKAVADANIQATQAKGKAA